jgi:hypothetical protein
MRASRHSRRGITVLEVLIAIGILAVGLASVAAIIPAAGSQGARAVILDRAAVHAANVLADAATFGLLRNSGTSWLGLTLSGSVVVLDLAGTSLGSSSAAELWSAGVYSSTTASGTAGTAAKRLFLESRDDVLVTPPATVDDPPTNLVIDGARGFTGRTTSLLCLSSEFDIVADTVANSRTVAVPSTSRLRPGFPIRGPVIVQGTVIESISTGTTFILSLPATTGTTTALTVTPPRRASVVVFHNRDTSTLVISGTLTNSSLTFTPPADRTATDIVRPGVVLWHPAEGRFHQIMAASPNADVSAIFITLGSGTTLATGTFPVQILPDSVGLAERFLNPETGGEFAP